MSALSGLRIIDCSTLFAGPTAASILSDFGAEVIKIEHPIKSDPVRGHGIQINDSSFWWAYLSRNKKTVSIDLSKKPGANTLLELVKESDVLIENFRPGTLEKWGIGPDALLKVNPKLIITRVTGFGQSGPYSNRPAFGTLAEAMSGFAAMTGEPDSPPTLPPFGLADGIAGITAAQAIMTALYARNNTLSENFSKGQVIDLAIYEPIMSILGPHLTAFRKLGIKQVRTGNRSSNNAPRNTYRTKDLKWIAISTSAQSIAERVITLVGHPELISEEWFKTGKGRAQHVDLLDTYVGNWIGQRNKNEVIAEFEKAEAAVAEIYSVEEISNDPQFKHRNTFIQVRDELIGEISIQNSIYKLDKTPSQINWVGRKKGENTREVLSQVAHLSDATIDILIKDGVVFQNEE